MGINIVAISIVSTSRHERSLSNTTRGIPGILPRQQRPGRRRCHEEMDGLNTLDRPYCPVLNPMNRRKHSSRCKDLLKRLQAHVKEVRINHGITYSTNGELKREDSMLEVLAF